jgi:hypothetical protein
MASTSQEAVDGLPTEPVGMTGRQFPMAGPTTAVVLGVLSLLALAANYALEALTQDFSASASGLADAATLATFVLAFTAVGVVVARRQPRRAMGWMLIAVALAVPVANDGSTYAYLDYTLHHGTLPLGQLALLLSSSWTYAIALVPLITLLFPDGRLGPRWRWPLRAYLTIAVLGFVGTLIVTVAAFHLRSPLDANGNVVGLNDPRGGNAWLAPIEFLFAAGCVSLVIAAIVYQTRRYRRASGERRQQLKWLAPSSASSASRSAVRRAAAQQSSAASHSASGWPRCRSASASAFSNTGCMRSTG